MMQVNESKNARSTIKISTRVIIFVVSFLVLTVVLAFASTSKLSPQEATQLNQTIAGIKPTTLGIFFNNARIDLIEFVPVLGPAFGVYVSYITGLAISAIAQSSSVQGISGFVALLALLITPIYWMEFFSYSLAVEESVSLVISARNKQMLRGEIRWLVGSVLLAIAVLFVSARLEASLVSMFT